MGKTVLIVDDEPDVRTYLTTVLKHHGYTVVTADAAQSGLAVVEESKPDIICLDIVMPKESGISLYRQLRADSRFRSIPVIIVSGVAPAQEFDFREFVPDRSVPVPDEYFEKPVEVNRLLEVIERLTAGSHAKSPSESASNAAN
jgi:CheY-like chemotaxis protein